MTAFMYFGCNVIMASLPVFLPTVISEMGAFTVVLSNGLTSPPYVFCFIAIISVGYSPMAHITAASLSLATPSSLPSVSSLWLP